MVVTPVASHGLWKKGNSLMTNPSPAETTEKIRLKAYELWDAEGRIDGRDREYWLKATAIVCDTAHEIDKELPYHEELCGDDEPEIAEGGTAPSPPTALYTEAFDINAEEQNIEEVFAFEPQSEIKTAAELRPVIGPLRGWVDGFGPNWVDGWVQDILNPDQPVLLDVLVDGVFAVQITADLYREDLHAARLGNGKHGFRVYLYNDAQGDIRVVRSTDRAEVPRGQHAIDNNKAASRR